MKAGPTQSDPDGPGSTPPRGAGAWLHTRLCWTCAFHLALRVMAIPLLVGAAILLYVSTVGFPGFVTRSFLARMEEQGVAAQCGKLRFDVRDGVIADDIAFYALADRSAPLLEAERVGLRLDLFSWLSGQSALTGLSVKGGLVRWSAGPEPVPADADQLVLLRDLVTRVTFEPAGYRFEEIDGRLLGMNLSGHGLVVKHSAASSPPAEPPAAPAKPLRKVLHAMPPWFGDLVRALNAVVYEDDAAARIDFTLHLGRPGLNQATLSAEGGRTRYRGVAFDGWGFEASLHEGRAAISNLTLRASSGSVTLDAGLRLADGVAEAHIRNDLPTTHWTSLIPAPWRAQWERAGVVLQQPLAGEAWLGPAPLEKLAEQVRVHLTAEQVLVRDVWVETAEMDLLRNGAELLATNLVARLGRDKRQGPLDAWMAYDLETQAVKGHARLAFDPSVLLPVLDVNPQKVIRRMQFEATPPLVDVDFAGVKGDPASFTWRGGLYATNFFYNGAFFKSFEAPEAYVADETMVMDPVRMVRDEGEIAGWTRQNFRDRLYRFDLVSSINPKIIGRMIGPNAEKFMRIYRVDGPVHIVAHGVVDYHTNELTRIDAHLTATNSGVKWFNAERCDLDLQARGRSLIITNITGVLYGGDVEAWATFGGIGLGTNVRYEVAATFTNVRLADLVMQVKQETGDPLRGALSGETHLTGRVGEGQGGTVLGAGTVDIQDGYLWRLPVLGGLSAMLSKLKVGGRFGAQTDFHCSYVVHDRALHSDDMVLDGQLITLLGSGSYSFSRELEFDIKVKPLKEGLFAHLVQFVTTPLTLLLDFHLDGTLEDPAWRPQNLPKELFGNME